jgi:hypothetical protein
MGRKSQLFTHSFSSLDSRFAEVEAEIAEISGLLRKYSRFGETMGGDRLDHDCRPRDLVGSAVPSPPLTATLFTGR